MFASSANTRLRVNNPGHGPEAGLEADQVEAEAGQHHGAVVAGAILGNKHRRLPRLPRGAPVAGPRLWLEIIGLTVSCPGHAPPRHGTLLGVIKTKTTILENRLTSVRF